MRIKTLLAAAVAVAAIPAMAADVPVYSQNIVGYINIPLTEGLNLVANQLDADGSGTANWTTNIFGSQLPFNSIVYAYTGTGYTSGQYQSNKITKIVKWNASPNCNPGRAIWVAIPTGAFGGTTQSVTTVGTVLQGPLVNPYLPSGAGLAFLGSMVPVTGGLVTNLNYQPKFNDIFYRYTGSGYSSSQYQSNKITKIVKWNAGEPFVNVSQGFWLACSQAGTVWSNNFTPTP